MADHKAITLFIMENLLSFSSVKCVWSELQLIIKLATLFLLKNDDPGGIKGIFKRGTKYPERVMNFTKSLISIMFAGTASGILLPYYIVY